MRRDSIDHFFNFVFRKYVITKVMFPYRSRLETEAPACRIFSVLMKQVVDELERVTDW